MLTSIDFTIIVLYGVMVAIVGFIAKRLVKNQSDYFAGGKKVPWWLAAISHHMSGYSAFAFVGHGSLAYHYGFSAWVFFGPPFFLAMVIGAYVWAPRWAIMKILTPIQYLEQRFNNTVRQVFGLSGIGIKFIDEGVKLYSLSLIVHVVTGWPLEEVIVVSGIITVVYLLFGGLWATILTDFVQFIIQFSITLILVPIVLDSVGGISGLVDQMPVESRSIFSERVTPGFLFVWFLFILLSYNGGSWGLAQRFYSIGKPKDAKKAALLSACLYLIYPFAIFIPIWAARSIVGNIEDAEQAYILVAQKVLSSISPGLLGLLVASMFAATMSMIDSDLNSMAAVFTKDIYQRNFNKNATDKVILRVGMISTSVLGMMTIAGGLMTIHMEGAFNAMIEWYAAIGGPVSIPLLMGLLFRKPTWRGAILSWLFGFLTFIFFKFAWPSLTGLPTYFALYTGMELVVSFTVFMAEGYFSKRSPEKEKEVNDFFRQFKKTEP